MNTQGSPATEQVKVWLGEPHEAYVMVPKHIGRVIEAACAPYGSSAHIAGPDTYPLIFDHKSRHFVHSKFSFIVILEPILSSTPVAMPFPRLTIPQDLPHQSNAPTSPATLFVCGPTDIITLNGTSDCTLGTDDTII